ncbi:MAG: hypothetical protein AAF611_15010 [Bacteroidota bacterium]
MKKKSLQNLHLKRATVSNLDDIAGGYQQTSGSGGSSTVNTFTRGGCDFPTIGHDDGPNCLSASDWGWCWCHGI